MKCHISSLGLWCLAFVTSTNLTVSQPAAAPEDSRRPAPRILKGFSIPERSSLAAAFRLAAHRISRDEDCGALFDGLDISGRDALRRSYYEPATTESDVALCRRGVAAISGVGLRRTRLCPVFQRHSTRGRAALLIHEALHVAGLGEQPVEPGKMTAHEITQWVKAACGL